MSAPEAIRCEGCGRRKRHRPSTDEPDHAEVAQLLNGTRTAHDAHPSSVLEAVHQLDTGRRSGNEIARRLGLSKGQVSKLRRQSRWEP